jgi:hypothetical protein
MGPQFVFLYTPIGDTEYPQGEIAMSEKVSDGAVGHSWRPG